MAGGCGCPLPSSRHLRLYRLHPRPGILLSPCGLPGPSALRRRCLLHCGGGGPRLPAGDSLIIWAWKEVEQQSIQTKTKCRVPSCTLLRPLGPPSFVQPQAVLAAWFWINHHQKAAASRLLGCPGPGAQLACSVGAGLHPPALLVKHRPARGPPGPGRGQRPFPAMCCPEVWEGHLTGALRSWEGAKQPLADTRKRRGAKTRSCRGGGWSAACG